jgi:hypothetical protein
MRMKDQSSFVIDFLSQSIHRSEIARKAGLFGRGLAAPAVELDNLVTRTLMIGATLGSCRSESALAVLTQEYRFESMDPSEISGRIELICQTDVLTGNKPTWFPWFTSSGKKNISLPIEERFLRMCAGSFSGAIWSGLLRRDSASAYLANYLNTLQVELDGFIQDYETRVRRLPEIPVGLSNNPVIAEALTRRFLQTRDHWGSARYYCYIRLLTMHFQSMCDSNYEMLAYYLHRSCNH